jgi:hypothetical protein
MIKMWICVFGLVYGSLLGQKISYNTEFRVNTYTQYDQLDPKMASLKNGGFVVCWQSRNQDGFDWDINSQDWGIYGQVFSADGTKINDEIHVNTYSKGEQKNPQIVSLSNGGFVVCWVSFNQDGSDWGVYGQIFSPIGTKVGGEFCVNTFTSSAQLNPQIASLPNDGFVVCWESYGQEGSNVGVYGQIFSLNGTKVGLEIRINTSTGYLRDPQITSFPNSGFAICWHNGGYDSVYVQVFSSVGTKVGNQLLVNTCTDYQRNYLKITSLPNGGFVVLWQSYPQDGYGYGVYGQVFASDGTKVGGEFRVNTYTQYDQFDQKIASLVNGGFAVCWTSNYQDGSGNGVYGQVFSMDGTKIGGEFRVNTYTKGDQENPQIVSLPNGWFVACWESYNHLGISAKVYGQVFSSNGAKVSNEFDINTNPEYMHSVTHASLQMISLLNGDFVICWVSWGQDGSEGGIYAKRFPGSPFLHTLIPFNLLEPSNDQSIKAINPRLHWRQPSNQVIFYSCELHYEIFVDDNPEFTSPQITEQDKDTTLTIQNLTPGTTYFWKVLAKNIAGDSLWSSSTNGFFVTRNATDVEEEKTFSPIQFVLHQNYPNPFNPETTIRFDLPETGLVEISVYDITGKLVKVLVNESKHAESYSVTWDGNDSAGNLIPSGIYFCRMEAQTASGKMFVKSVKMGLVR